MIAAVEGKAKRINVIMPFLYEGRQHKRSGRESLDCAYALTELAEMGVTNFITFDAHDPRVQNATPLCGFDNFTPPYQFMRALLDNVPDLIIDKDHMMVISPMKAHSTVPLILQMCSASTSVCFISAAITP